MQTFRVRLSDYLTVKSPEDIVGRVTVVAKIRNSIITGTVLRFGVLRETEARDGEMQLVGTVEILGPDGTLHYALPYFVDVELPVSVLAVPELEPKVAKFAGLMQRELTANSYKGDWEEFTSVPNILSELEWHKAKLLFALRENDSKRVVEHCADCANIFLFLTNAAVLGALV